jgi:hypothetical protein
MADPVVTIVNGVPNSGTGTLTTLGQTLLDGANATSGSTSDAAVAAGAVGTVSAKLRAISRDIAAGVSLQASAAVIGTVRVADAAGTGITSTGAALDVNIKSGASSGAVAQGSTTSGQTGSLIQGAVTTAAPAYTTAQTSPLSLDTAGNLRVNVVTGGAGGGIVTQATAANLNATVVNAAGAAIIGKVGIDQTTPGTTNLVSAGQSGTWTVQPGNTANTTAWKVQLYDGTTAFPILAGSSGAPATSAPAIAVSIRDVNANGRAAAASSAPVAISTEDNTLLTRGLLPTATASGATASRINAAASTNATPLKASAGQVYTIDVFNAAAYNVFLKLYNKASAPTVGTDPPVMTIPIQAGGGFSKTWPNGFPFATGIAYAITKLQPDSDTTVVVAGDLTGNTTWI